MILCSCSGLTDTEARMALAKGCTTRAQIYKFCGKRPKCGGCFGNLQRLAHEVGVDLPDTSLFSQSD